MGKKILIVDDSATARLLVKMCLNKIGDFEIIEAGTEEKALERDIIAITPVQKPKRDTGHAVSGVVAKR